MRYCAAAPMPTASRATLLAAAVLLTAGGLAAQRPRAPDPPKQAHPAARPRPDTGGLHLLGIATDSIPRTAGDSARLRRAPARPDSVGTGRDSAATGRDSAATGPHSAGTGTGRDSTGTGPDSTGTGTVRDSTAAGRDPPAGEHGLLGVPVAAPPPPSAAVLGRPLVDEAGAAAPPRLLGVPLDPADSTPLPPPGRAFLAAQLQEPRVRRASLDSDAQLRARFRKLDIPFPPAALFLRAFKREHRLEAWVQPRPGAPYRLLETFAICSISGALGPKSASGDDQTPEGFYFIDGFNPRSDYWLALAVDYPNAADRIRARGADPGGDIFVHGGCRTAGCLPLTNAGISRLYWLAVQARAAGQRRIPLHIFPTRLDSVGVARLDSAFATDTARLAFWASLLPGYRYFELRRHVPDLWTDAAGRYHVAQLDPRPVRDASGLLGVPVGGAPPRPDSTGPPPKRDSTGVLGMPLGAPPRPDTAGPPPKRDSTGVLGVPAGAPPPPDTARPRPKVDSTGVRQTPSGAPPRPDTAGAALPPDRPTGTASAPGGSGSPTAPGSARSRPRAGSGTG